jgi:hypothetical protein
MFATVVNEISSLPVATQKDQEESQAVERVKQALVAGLGRISSSVDEDEQRWCHNIIIQGGPLAGNLRRLYYEDSRNVQLL